MLRPRSGLLHLSALGTLAVIALSLISINYRDDVLTRINYQ
jgi:hypothetical protein